MRRTLLCFLTLFLAVILDAQGVYTCYNFDAPRVNTPAPEGYNVFYISHYGRHGARYIYSENEYAVLDSVLSKASLTPLGKQVRDRFEALYPSLKGRAGELSPLGEAQQYLLARRMMDELPEVFSRYSRVEAVSSDVPRCVRSMHFFLEGLRQGGKKRRISGNVDASLLPALKNGPFHLDNVDSLFLAGFDMAPVYERLFDNAQSAKELADSLVFVRSLYYFCAHLPSAGFSREPLMEQAFSSEEWGVLNSLEDQKFSLHGGWSRPSNVARIWPLVENFIDEADLAIASGNKKVRLRFGHDNVLIPFMAFLKMGPFTAELFNCSDCPMGANVRWIFASNKDDVLVKVQYNESDVSQWMPWNEFRKDCLDKIAWAKQVLSK